MQRVILPGLLLLAATLLAPGAAGEFGSETEDGWPINIHGEVMRPPGSIAQLDLVTTPQPLNKIGPATIYPYYPILTAELNRLALEYPHLVKLTSAGKSVAQLDLWMLEIADFENPDMIPLEDREVVYLDGGIHSNEYSAVYMLTEIAQFLIEEYDSNETAKWIVENRHTWMIPMVNPDGSHVFGRMNAHWVNVNRNFPATWGTVNENVLLNNPGPEPASEPETKVILRVLDEMRPDFVNSIHCCGNLWLHPWGAEEIPEADDIEMFTRICDEVFAPQGVRERCGPIWSTIYPASGTTADEGYGRIGASSWTYEMSGRGAISLWGQPAIIEDVRYQERESWAGTIHAFLHVHKYGAHPEVVQVSGTPLSLDVTIENIGYGPLVAGNVTIGDAKVQIPAIGPSPGNLTTVKVPGAFAPGTLTIDIDWTKRILHAPQGSKSLTLTLQEAEDGRLVGVFDGEPGPAEPQREAVTETVSIVALPLVAFALLALLAIARRRR